MHCLDKFKKKMELSGGTLRQEHILDSKRIINTTFADDSSYTLGLYMWKHGLKDYSDERQLEIRLYSRRFSSANGELVSFHTELHEPIIVGDIVYDSIHDEYMICTEVMNINEIHYQGKFTMCNWILKWQNKQGKIFEYPCQDMNSTQYNSGETPNKLFTSGTSQHMITLPCDENTVILDTPQRFYLDKNPINPTSFIVSQNDTTSYNYGKKGLIKLTLTQFVGISERDRVDLGICDYVDINKIEEDDNVNVGNNIAEINHSSTSIKCGGSPRTYTAKFYDANNNEIVKTPLWEIVCDFKDELEVNQLDNQITISINNDDYIDEVFKLILYDANDLTCTKSLIITIDSLL